MDLSYLIECIPTLPPPIPVAATGSSLDSSQPVVESEYDRGWDISAVVEPHRDSSGRGKQCDDPSLFWCPFTPPYDFSLERYRQARLFQRLFYFYASDKDLEMNLYFLTYLQRNVVGILETRVNMDYYALPCLEQGSITFSFLLGRAMFGPQLPPDQLQNAVNYFDFRSVGFDMTKARTQLMDAAHALGEYLSPRTIYMLLRSFQRGTEGAPNSTIHLICGSLLASEIMEHMKSHESPSDHLKRLSNLMELLDARALEDRMKGRVTYNQPALEDG